MLQEFTEKLKAGKGLSESEAEQALEWILSSEVSADTAIGDFLIALAEKGETVDEIVGFARVMRRHLLPLSTRHRRFVDTAGTGGGAATFNVSTAAAFAIAGAGVPVAKHGNRAITSRSGSADVLLELGVRIDAPRERSEQALDELGICFMFAPHFHPAMARVAGIRRQLGRRTIFNMLGPLTNPAGAPCQVIGVYAEPLTRLLGQALARLGCQRAWVVHGRDGLDEVSIGAPTQVVEVTGSEVQAFLYQPPRIEAELPAGGDAAENAALIRRVLAGEERGPARRLVLVNAAAALHVTTGEPMEEALKRAGEAIDSGAAEAKLAGLAALVGDGGNER